MNTMECEARFTSNVMPKREVALVRGAGARVWDEDGREYIDCMTGHGVALVGHCNPAVVAAICEQASRLITCPETVYNDVRARFLERLVAVAPDGLERVFLCNSGTEAVEAAIKFARLSTGRTGIVAAMKSFHGRTMGALSATWEKKYREPFEPLVPGFSHVPYNKIEALREAVDDNTAAVLLEPVQGEGGVTPADEGYLEAARALCQQTGALLILDEVQTGFGRTGRLFACQRWGVTPDILCLAKAIAGGVPMGAVLLGSAVGNIQPGVHGTTFGGNPLACAAALATIDYITAHDLVAEAERKGNWLRAQLEALEAPVIRQVRGLGLMIGIELRQRVTPYLKALMDRGILALPAGNTVLRLLPPLVISDDDLRLVVGALREVLAG
jgi:acetylornithine/LysW-gamma-L-lysine aminotransferase